LVTVAIVVVVRVEGESVCLMEGKKGEKKMQEWGKRGGI